MYRKNQTFRETQSKPVSKAKHDYATNKLKFEKYILIHFEKYLKRNIKYKVRSQVSGSLLRGVL